MNQKTIGILVMLGASLMWALEPIFAKFSYEASSVLYTVIIRSVMILLIATIYTFLTNRGNFKINKLQLSAIAYIAIVGTVVADFLYLYSLTKIPVINAVLIGHMQPIFIVLIGFFMLEDKLNFSDYLGILFMIVAGILVSSGTLENLLSFKFGNLEDLLVLIATICWATTVIATKKYLSKSNSGVITFYRAIISLVLLSTFFLFTSKISFPNIYQILLGIFVGFGTILYYEGLKRIKAAQASALELSTPFFAAILSFLFLKEMVTLLQIIGLILLVIGVYFISKKERIKNDAS